MLSSLIIEPWKLHTCGPKNSKKRWYNILLNDLFGPPRPGLGNVRPAGHMQPAKHLYVAHEIFLVDKTLKMPLLKCLFFRKWTAISPFSLKSQII